MRELIYYVAMSLDGYIAHSDGSWDGFTHDEEFVADFLGSLQEFSAVLMGRKTYEVGLAEGKTNPYPHLRQFVFSRSLEESPDPAVELVADDALGKVRALRKEPGDDGKGIWLCGGGHLASQCLEADLIDRMVVKVNPVLFGDGIPLFAPRQHTFPLALEGTRTYGCGIVTLTYSRGQA